MSAPRLPPREGGPPTSPATSPSSRTPPQRGVQLPAMVPGAGTGPQSLRKSSRAPMPEVNTALPPRRQTGAPEVLPPPMRTPPLPTLSGSMQTLLGDAPPLPPPIALPASTSSPSLGPPSPRTTNAPPSNTNHTLMSATPSPSGSGSASPSPGSEGLRLREGDSAAASSKSLVVAGTLDAFIQKLLQDAKATKLDYDYDFIDLFLVSHPCFVASEEVLSKLLKLYSDAPLMTKDRITLIFKKWWDGHGLRFKSGLVADLQQWLQDPVVYPEHADILRNVMKKFPPGPPPSSVDSFREARTEGLARAISVLELSPRMLAEQICLMDSEIFSGLAVDEFYHQNWIKHPEKAPHLKSFTERFNKISYWLQTEVVTTIALKDRVKVVSKIVNLGNELYDLRNYNSCVMVWSAIGASSICRLKHTFALLAATEKEQLEKMNAMMESANGFKNYRNLTRNCDPPMIPYFGLTMTDLVYMDEKADKVDDLINFEKWSQVGKTLLDMRKLQKESYRFPEVTTVQNFFRSPLCILSEPDIRKYSLFIEPRDCLAKDLKKIKKRDPSLPAPSVNPDNSSSSRTSSSLLASSNTNSAANSPAPVHNARPTVAGTLPRRGTGNSSNPTTPPMQRLENVFDK